MYKNTRTIQTFAPFNFISFQKIKYKKHLILTDSNLLTFKFNDISFVS